MKIRTVARRAKMKASGIQRSVHAVRRSAARATRPGLSFTRGFYRLIEGQLCVGVSRQLALEAIEAMLDARGIGDAFRQQIECVLPRRLQVLEAVLVMDGERLLGFAAQRRRASRQHG